VQVRIQRLAADAHDGSPAALVALAEAEAARGYTSRAVLLALAAASALGCPGGAPETATAAPVSSASDADGLPGGLTDAFSPVAAAAPGTAAVVGSAASPAARVAAIKALMLLLTLYGRACGCPLLPLLFLPAPADPSPEPPCVSAPPATPALLEVIPFVSSLLALVPTALAPALHAQLALVLCAAGALDDAMELATSAVTAEPKAPALRLALAWVATRRCADAAAGDAATAAMHARAAGAGLAQQCRRSHVAAASSETMSEQPLCPACARVCAAAGLVEARAWSLAGDARQRDRAAEQALTVGGDVLR
jgi:hypothetical protein